MQFSLSNIKVIAGLGNIGDKYKKTRHNAGFLFLDALTQDKLSWKEDRELECLIAELGEIKLIKPTTMMNASGRAIQKVLSYYKIKPEELLIAHDDLDIPIGMYKLQFGKGPKVHNGLTSVNHQLGTEDYWRLRIGIEAREVKGNKGVPGIKYSLANFYPVELTQIQQVLSEAIDNLQ